MFKTTASIKQLKITDKGVEVTLNADSKCVAQLSSLVGEAASVTFEEIQQKLPDEPRRPGKPHRSERDEATAA